MHAVIEEVTSRIERRSARSRRVFAWPDPVAA
jgi:hypothetical protein